VLNGSGYKALDANTGKDVVLRVQAFPVGWLLVEASALRGVRGATNDDQFWDASLVAEVKGPHQRLIAEVIAGHSDVDGPRDELGFDVAGAWDVPLSGKLDHASFVGRFLTFDPNTANAEGDENAYPDNWWIGAGSAMLYWRAGEKQSVWTGLTWETCVPQNVEEAIEHQLVLQTGAKF
jgi:hypothetical protein